MRWKIPYLECGNGALVVVINGVGRVVTNGLGLTGEAKKLPEREEG